MSGARREPAAGSTSLGAPALAVDATGAGTNWSRAFRSFLVDMTSQTGVLWLQRGGASWIEYTPGVPSVPEGGFRNVILREEAMALGRFGVISLPTLHSGKFPDEVVANRNAELGY